MTYSGPPRRTVSWLPRPDRRRDAHAGTTAAPMLDAEPARADDASTDAVQRQHDDAADDAAHGVGSHA